MLSKRIDLLCEMIASERRCNPDAISARFDLTLRMVLSNYADEARALEHHLEALIRVRAEAPAAVPADQSEGTASNVVRFPAQLRPVGTPSFAPATLGPTGPTMPEPA